MSRSNVYRVLSLVAERVARAKSGTAFAGAKAASGHPERLAGLTPRLHWMSPLEALTREEQELLGLRTARPSGAEDDELHGPDALAAADPEISIPSGRA